MNLGTQTPTYADLHFEEAGQKSLCTQQKDILCRLKYALPCLPEKLLKRLYSTSTDQDKKQFGSENKFTTTSKCNTENKSIFSEDGFDKEVGVYRERGTNTYGTVYDADYNGKSRFFIYGNEFIGNKKVSNIDSKDENGSPTLKTGDGDFKFHLNDSRTWTMTYFEDSVDDLENTDQGHPHRFWSPLTEELADLATCDYWLDYELLD